MDPEELQFRYFWAKEVERERMMQVAKMIGTAFTAGEVRKWAEQGDGTREYKKNDLIYMPLTLALRPELREMLIKMVGADGLMMPKDYQGRKNEIMIDMGQVSHQEFRDFVEKKILPKPKRQTEED